MTPPPAARRPPVAASAPTGVDGVRGDPAEAMVNAVARGDHAAFADLYDLFSERVYGLVRRVVRDPGHAEDVTQEVFLQVWRTATRFDRRRGTPVAWILTLAHARAVDRVRSVQAAGDREQRAARSATERPADTVSEQVQAGFERRAVRRCLSALTELQRESIELAYYSGYSYPEVATILGAPLPTIKTRMRDGLIRLRDCLGVGT